MNETLLQQPASLAPLAILDFRRAFLTASTWAQATATEVELVYALLHWAPGQPVATAIAALLLNRNLDRRGLRRRLEREALEAAGEASVFHKRREKRRPGANTTNTTHTKGDWDL